MTGPAWIGFLAAAAVGAPARFLVDGWIEDHVGDDFPWGTLIVNLTGSLVMGALAAWFAFRSGPLWTQEMRLFATTGFLGGFTTFSAFSLDAALLWERNAFVPFAIYVLASVGLSILGLFVGLWIVRSAI